MALVVFQQPALNQTTQPLDNSCSSFVPECISSSSAQNQQLTDRHSLVFQLCQFSDVVLEKNICFQFFNDFKAARSSEALKKNFRKLSLKCHPDKVRETMNL